MKPSYQPGYGVADCPGDVYEGPTAAHYLVWSLSRTEGGHPLTMRTPDNVHAQLIAGEQRQNAEIVYQLLQGKQVDHHSTDEQSQL